MDCKTFRSELPELVLDPLGSTGSTKLKHASECHACEQEFLAIMATMSLMDSWKAPEPSPYFDQRLAVRLREEVAAPRMGFFARLQDRLLFSTGRQLRPALAGGLALALVLGGGTYAGLGNGSPWSRHSQVSAAVNDLQILDKDETALQQMDQLLQDDSESGDTGSNAPS